MKQLYFLLIPFLFLFQSCEVINPDEDIPTFIKIDSIGFSSEFDEGTAKQVISDSWVYVNGDLIGTFEMPFEIPVLKSGASTISIFPGVKLNGISGTRTINPFFTTIEKDVDLKVGQTVSLIAESKYKDGIKFPWNNRGEEDFEEGGISIDSIGNSSTKVIKTTTEVFEGTGSGYIKLDAEHKTFYGESTEYFTLPQSGAAVVMEINIKNDVPFVIGMFAYLPGGTVVSNDHLGVNPGDNWKKLYVNFTELVSNYPTALKYKVFFKANIGSQEEGNVYLDNIKIMHF